MGNSIISSIFNISYKKDVATSKNQSKDETTSKTIIFGKEEVMSPEKNQIEKKEESPYKFEIKKLRTENKELRKNLEKLRKDLELLKTKKDESPKARLLIEAREELIKDTEELIKANEEHIEILESEHAPIKKTQPQWA